MRDYQELLQQAKTLGEAISRHPRATALRAAHESLNRDSAARKILDDYARHAEHLRELEAGNRPIEVDDKRRLAELERGMIGNDAIKALMRVQADYIEMMTQINQAMEAPLASVESQEPPQ
ncbi:MAG: YlbF family regulator [Phycisphaerae bacterium]